MQLRPVPPSKVVPLLVVTHQYSYRMQRTSGTRSLTFQRMRQINKPAKDKVVGGSARDNAFNDL